LIGGQSDDDHRTTRLQLGLQRGEVDFPGVNHLAVHIDEINRKLLAFRLLSRLEWREEGVAVVRLIRIVLGRALQHAGWPTEGPGDIQAKASSNGQKFGPAQAAFVPDWPARRKASPPDRGGTVI